MIYLPRRALSTEAQEALDTYQAEVGQTPPAAIDAHWKARRARLAKLGVVDTLLAMVGPRGRCMYCGNGRGHQIEHYWPKAHHLDLAYRWTNLLWLCGDCNLKKGDVLALDGQGQPLLLDPSCDEPLKHMEYVPSTGEWTARVDPTTGLVDPRGEETCNPARLPLNLEAITEGRRRAWKRLKRAVAAFVDAPGADTEAAMVEEFAETERPDVAAWAISPDTVEDIPFAALHRDHPGVALQLAWVVSAAPR